MEIDEKRVSILHLICGLPGSGKTTLAKEIEKSLSAVRLCPDEWIKDIWGNELAEKEGNEFRDQIEQLQWKMGKNILKSGTDIIIEWGTWGKSEREKLRDETWGIGSKVKFYYLDVPIQVLKERIINRNKNLGSYEFLMPEETLDLVIDSNLKSFQIPDSDELSSYDFLG